MDQVNLNAWNEIKNIVCGAAAALEIVCNELPKGTIKNVLCGVVSILKLVCSWIPDEEAK